MSVINIYRNEHYYMSYDRVALLVLLPTTGLARNFHLVTMIEMMQLTWVLAPFGGPDQVAVPVWTPSSTPCEAPASRKKSARSWSGSPPPRLNAAPAVVMMAAMAAGRAQWVVAADVWL